MFETKKDDFNHRKFFFNFQKFICYLVTENKKNKLSNITKLIYKEEFHQWIFISLKKNINHNYKHRKYDNKTVYDFIITLYQK